MNLCIVCSLCIPFPTGATCTLAAPTYKFSMTNWSCYRTSKLSIHEVIEFASTLADVASELKYALCRASSYKNHAHPSTTHDGAQPSRPSRSASGCSTAKHPDHPDRPDQPVPRTACPTHDAAQPSHPDHPDRPDRPDQPVPRTTQHSQTKASWVYTASDMDVPS